MGNVHGYIDVRRACDNRLGAWRCMVKPLKTTSNSEVEAFLMNANNLVTNTYRVILIITIKNGIVE